MIKKSKQTSNYSILPNAVANDERLQLRDLGLLAYLISKPPAWQISATHLAEVRKVGRGQIYGILNRLKAAGYATWTRSHDGKTDWVIYDDANAPKDGPHAGKPDVVKPDVAIGTLVSKESLVSKVKDTPIAPKGACPHQEIISIYHEQLPELPKITVGRWPGSRDARQLQTRWNEDKTHQALEFWRDFFSVVRTNPFWLGENDRGWKADFRWLVKRGNFDKVIDRWTNMETQG